jgi:hypothetical protein
MTQDEEEEVLRLQALLAKTKNELVAAIARVEKAESPLDEKELSTPTASLMSSSARLRRMRAILPVMIPRRLLERAQYEKNPSQGPLYISLTLNKGTPTFYLSTSDVPVEPAQEWFQISRSPMEEEVQAVSAAMVKWAEANESKDALAELKDVLCVPAELLGLRDSSDRSDEIMRQNRSDEVKSISR